IYVLVSFRKPTTIGLKPFGSRAAYTALSSDTKVKQNEPTISFFRIESALPSLPFSDMSETNRFAAINVSLTFWGVKVHPPTIPDNSSTLDIVPLCAMQRSFTFNG